MKIKSNFMVLVIMCHATVMADISKGPVTSGELRARMGEIEENLEFRKVIDSSTEVYKSIIKGEHGEVPMSVLRNSKCIAILPNVVTGAFVLGATHGDGLATCRNVDRAWSQPAAISLNRGSIGLQAGAKSADLVIFFQTEKAVEALKRGSFVLGDDVSATAGKFGANVDTSPTGVVVYSRTGGLFAGVSVSGSKISKEPENIKRYFGRDADFAALLEGKDAPDASGYSRKLTDLLP